MRYLAILAAALILVGCGTAPVNNTGSSNGEGAHVPASELQGTSTEPPVQFLVSAAATDFHTFGRRYYPTNFRSVRVGYVMTDNGEKQYMLCGEFLPEKKDGDSTWTPFATIKTARYEQWIGGQASGFCQQTAITWIEHGDLSLLLQKELDSLQ